jgi:hypothetical protein
MKEKKYYDNFFKFWEDNYPRLPEYIKHVALEAWDAAVNGSELSDSELYSEAVSRGFEIKEDKSDLSVCGQCGGKMVMTRVCERCKIFVSSITH